MTSAYQCYKFAELQLIDDIMDIVRENGGQMEAWKLFDRVLKLDNGTKFFSSNRPDVFTAFVEGINNMKVMVQVAENEPQQHVETDNTQKDNVENWDDDAN